MKTIREFLLLAFGLCMVIACNDFDEIIVAPEEPTDESINWVDFLDLIDMESGIILVKHGTSIQNAIDNAQPGDVIYIEPGIYKEKLSVTTKGIRLIGLGDKNNEMVTLENPGGQDPAIILSAGEVEVYNLDMVGYTNSGVEIKQLESNNFKSNRGNFNMNRKDLGGGIAHYIFDLPMGYGEFDRVRLHRIVKEQRPYKPIRTRGNIFMVHGAIQDFDDIFLTAGAANIDEETSAPYYLASNRIDVWGIDLGWTMVPIETSEFTFMQNWGIERDAEHTLVAISFARLIRALTRQDFDGMNLLGFSYGVYVAYGAAGFETQMNPILRNVGAIIPVDGQLKYNNSIAQNASCDRADIEQEMINTGEYHNPWGVGLISLGNLALTAPDDPAGPPFDAFGLTNLQVLNFIGSDHSAGWHFFGGNAMGLTYTDPARFVNLSVNLSPHMPRLMFYEMAACGCPDKDVSFDDNLEDINIPILYVSAEGGEGPNGDYTSTLTSSEDITWLNIDDPTQSDPALDFGHADLWMARNAADWHWEKLYKWLVK